MQPELSTSNGSEYFFYHENAARPLPPNTSAANVSHDVSGQLFSDVVGVWVTGVACLAGTVGNVLSFLVLTRAHSRSPMFYVLRAVALSDALFLLSVFIIQTIVNLYPAIGVLEWCAEYRGFIQMTIWPVLMFTQMSTVWLTVLVSIERYVAICHPLHAASICTISKVRRAVVLIFLASLVYNIPRYFEYHVVDRSFLDKTAVGQNLVYRYLYTCVLYSLVLFLVPLLLLITLNGRLVLELQRGKKHWASLQVRQKKEQNLSVIPLTIVVVFILCGTPALIVNILDSISPELVTSPRFLIFMVVANLLVVLNSAANFIIYCLLGKKFRSKLLEMCHCRWRTTYQPVTVHNMALQPPPGVLPESSSTQDDQRSAV